MSVLLIGLVEREAITEAIRKAELNPVDIQALLDRMGTEAEARKAHREMMQGQRITIPRHWQVVYSVEFGHPCGWARHISMSNVQDPKLEVPASVLWTVAEAFGFTGCLHKGAIYLDPLSGGGHAINFVQPMQRGTMH